LSGNQTKKKNKKPKSNRGLVKRRGVLVRQQPISISALEKKVRDNPADINSALILAEQYYKTNQEFKILDVLRPLQTAKFKQQSPLKFRFVTLLALGYAFAGELSEAERVCDQGLVEFPDALDFYYVLSYVKLALREFVEVQQCGEKYLQILRYKPVLEGLPLPLCGMKAHLSQLQNFVANAYREQKQIDQAAIHYNAAISAYPCNHLPYLNLATMYSHAGDSERALEIINKGLSNCEQVQELRMLAQTFQNKRTISACLIVKDEEKLLPGCLESIRNWVDEIIVVDTGSNDKTVSIALSFGAKVFSQQWEGNFSKHRNFSLEKATSDWVLVIDADERFCEEDVPRLKELINSDQHSIVSINVYNVYGKNEQMTTFLPSVRLFRRALNLRYEGIVHNRINFPPDAAIVRANVKLKHLGYDLSQVEMRRKFERSHALLQKQLAKDPEDAFALFNLAQLLRGAAKDNPDLFSDEIIRLASRAVALTKPNELLTRNIHLMCLDQLAWAYFYKGDYRQALHFALKAISHKSNYLDPLLLLGHIYSQAKEYDNARDSYLRYLDVQAHYDPTSEKDNLILVNPDSRTSAYYGLAILAELQGQTDDAVNYYQKTIELDKDFLEASKRLQEVKESRGEKSFETTQLMMAQQYFENGQYAEAIEHYQAILSKESKNARVINDLANSHFKLKQYDTALHLYETASKLPYAPTIMFRNLGVVCSILKHYGKAVVAFQKYLESSPNDTEIVGIVADLYSKSGDFATALPLYEKTLKVNPRDCIALFNLAECYLNMGHEDSARMGYTRVLQIDSEFEPAKKRLEQLQASVVSS